MCVCVYVQSNDTQEQYQHISLKVVKSGEKIVNLFLFLYKKKTEMKKIRSGQQRQSKTFVYSTCSDLFESYYLIEGVVKKLLQLSQLIYTTLVYEPQSRRLCVKMEQTYKRFPYSFSNLAIQLVEWNGETRNVCLYFVCLFVYYVRLTLSFLGLSLLFGWGEGKRDQEKDFTWETKEKKTKKIPKNTKKKNKTSV